MKDITRRSVLVGTGSVAAATLLVGPSRAQTFPSKPIEIVVGQPPGGGTDLYGRAIALAMAPFLNGQSAVVLNRPGGNAVLGMEVVMSSAPDGHTLSLTSAGTAVIKKIWDGNGPDLATDFRPVATIGRYSSCIVLPKDSPYTNGKEWMDAVKASSSPILWAHTGRGSIHHIAAQALLSKYELPTRDVPYQGSGEARTALLNGEVEFAVFGTQNLTGFEDQLKTVGVIADERDPMLPDGQTFAEQGIDTPLLFTPIMLHAPKDTDDATLAAVEEIVRQAAETELYAETTKKAGLTVWYLSSADTQAWTENAQKDWTPIIEEVKAASG